MYVGYVCLYWRGVLQATWYVHLLYLISSLVEEEYYKLPGYVRLLLVSSLVEEEYYKPEEVRHILDLVNESLLVVVL